MNLKLKKYAEDNLGVKSTDSDEVVEIAIAKALSSGKLTADKYAELIKCPGDGDKAKQLADMISKQTADAVVKGLSGPLDSIGKGLTALAASNTKAKKKAEEEDEEEEDGPPKEKEDDVPCDPETEDCPDEEEMKGKKKPKGAQANLDKLVDEKLEKALSRFNVAPQIGGDGASLKSYDILKMGIDAKKTDPVLMRVKGAVERFDHTPTAALGNQRSKAFRGKPLVYQGKGLNVPTPRRLAMVHAWAKFTTYPEHLTEHDRDIVQYILHTEKFYADPESTGSRKLTDGERHALWNGMMTKALINDGTSGGQYAIPEFFDEDIIILPVLGNELAPYVDMMDVPRGTAAQGFTMDNVTFAAANTEGSAVSLFTTTSFIANHDTTFFRAAGFIEVGRNFLQDAVSTMGAAIVDSYKRKAAEWLDRVIAAGDGTNEPQGVTVASGTTDVTAGTPTTGPLTITDVLNLLFGVSKAFRYNFPTSQAAFGMTDTSYKRLRSLATGVTGDARLIFGMDVEDYTLFNHPVGIEENGLTNADIFFAQLGGYKMYRRQGLRLIREEAGATLVRANTILLGADMRYGGQLKRGGYAAVMDSAPA